MLFIALSGFAPLRFCMGEGMSLFGSSNHITAAEIQAKQDAYMRLYQNQLNSLGGIYGNRQANQANNGNPAGQSGIGSGTYLAITNPDGTTSPIPREGIRAGEITAYRYWLLTPKKGWLKSASADKIWLPSEPMEGDIEKHGIYCFKHMAFVEEYCGGGSNPVIFGSIEIWGEVVEHQNGYRAQFARIKSLDEIHGVEKGQEAATLKKLRARYGIKLTDKRSRPSPKARGRK